MRSAQLAGDEARYALVPYIVQRVVLRASDGLQDVFELDSAQKVRDFDLGVDGQVLDLVIAEVWERGAAAVFDAGRAFLARRTKRTQGTEEIPPAGTGDNSTKPAAG